MAVILSEETYRGFLDAVRDIETGIIWRNQVRPGVVDTSGVHHEFVQINSTTLTSGRYQGQIAVYNTAANTWSLLGSSGAIWVVTPNGETLVTATQYEARLYGSVSGVPVFMVDTGLSAAVFPAGVLVTNTGNQSLSSGVTTTLSWDTTVYDTGSIFSSPSTLVLPSGNWLIGASVELDSHVYTSIVLDIFKSAIPDCGSVVPGTAASGGFYLNACAIVPSGSYGVEVRQSSGGAANVLGTGSSAIGRFWATRVH